MSRPIHLSSEHFNPQPGYIPASTSSPRPRSHGSRRGDRELRESMARLRLAPDEAQMHNLYNKVKAEAHHAPAPTPAPAPVPAARTAARRPRMNPAHSHSSHVQSGSSPSPTIRRNKAIMRRPGLPKRTKSKQKTVRYADQQDDPYYDINILDNYFEEESVVSSDVTTSTQTSNEDYYLDADNRESRKHFEALRELDDYVRKHTVDDGRPRPVPMKMLMQTPTRDSAPAPKRAPLSFAAASSESSADRMPPPQPRRSQSTRNGGTRPLNLPIHKLVRAEVGHVSGNDSDKTLVSDTPPRPAARAKSAQSRKRNPKENPLLNPTYPVNEPDAPPITNPQEFFSKDPYRRAPDGHELACYESEPALKGRGHERQRPISRPRREEVGCTLPPDLARRLHEWHTAPQTELDLRSWEHKQEKKIRRGLKWFFLGQRMEDQRQNPWNRPDPPIAKHAFGM